VEVESWAHSNVPELVAVVVYQARTGATAAAVAAFLAAAPGTAPTPRLGPVERARAQFERTSSESAREDSPAVAATTQADGGIFDNPLDQAKTENMDAERAAAGTVTAWDLCESLLRSPTAPRPSASAGGGPACERVVVAAGAHLAAWEAQFARLVAYKAAHGDCNVPTAWAEDPALGRWAGKQRKLKRKLDRGDPSDGMTAARAARLEALGLAWDTQDAFWEAQLARLAAYKAAHGDCNVPNRGAEDPRLGQLVSSQRRRKMALDCGDPRDGMTAARAARLEALGFAWNFHARRAITVPPSR
jgi:hypothetical protein